MNIIVGCEESQAVTIELRKLGHNAYSCDIQKCSGGHPEWHICGDVFKAINFECTNTENGDFLFVDNWDMGIFFPDCTYLTVTANKWFKDQPKRESGTLVGQERRDAREEAIVFVKRLMNSNIDKIAVENPVGVLSTRFRKPDQIIEPYHFGHPQTKKTCLWLKNLPKLIPTKIMEPEYVIYGGKKYPKWMYKDMDGKSMKERQKARSVTFTGVAKAIAKQWAGKP